MDYKVLGLRNSDTLAINELVKMRKEAGLEVYNFGLGEAPFSVPKSMTDTLIEHVHKKSYTSSTGIYPLRKTITKFHKAHFDMDISPRQVIVGPGSKELLLTTMQIIDSDWLIPTPCWVTYPHQVKMTGRQLFKVNLDEKNGYRITAKQLRKTFNEIEGDVQASQLSILLNYPNNPTGLTLTDIELQNIARFAQNNELLILSDEIYANLTFSGTHESISRYYPEGTITTTGMSKDRSAGGWRVGVAILPDQDDLINAFQAWGSESYSCYPEMIQYGAIAGYRVNEEITSFIEVSREIHKKMCHFAHKELIKVGYHVTKTEGGFYLFPRLNHMRFELQEKGIFTSNDLVKRLMDEYHVAVLPGTSFGLDPSELVFRMAMVDYDGDPIMSNYIKGKIDNLSKNSGIDKLKHFFMELLV